MSARFFIFFLTMLFARSVSADSLDSGWTFALNCGSSYAFSAHRNGFDASGRCERTGTNYTKFSFDTASGGTLLSSVRYGLSTGDVLIVPPVLNTETQPVFSVASACPVSSNTLNWIYVQWNSPTTLNDTYLLGQAYYSTTVGLRVTMQYNVNGAIYWDGNLAMPGTCNPQTGVYTSTGAANLGGDIYFTKMGAGVFKTGPGKATFFFPQYTFSPAADLSGWSVQGITFDSTQASNTRPVRVTTNNAGMKFTVRPYQDAEAGILDSTYTDLIQITQANYPKPGMMVGTVTRSGAGAGTGKIACIVNKATSVKVICSGQSPASNSTPYNISFVKEGVQVLGQPNALGRANVEKGLDSPQSAIVVNGKLIVADGNNNRVLIWNAIPNVPQKAADVVLGQPTLFTKKYNNGGVSARSLRFPCGVASDGTRLFVADTNNNRVLIWNSIPTTNQQPADLVLGQLDMSSSTDTYGQESASNLSAPRSVETDGTRLFVTTPFSNRVLIWNSIPTANYQPADLVLGQPDFSSNLSRSGANGFNQPVGTLRQGNRLYVVDYGNHRVLIWNTVPTSNFQPADLVLGQPDPATQSSATMADVSASSTYLPYFVRSDGTRIYVGDAFRTLVWNSPPTANNQPADLVLGQPNFTSYSSSSASPQTLYYPTGMASDGSRVLMTDLYSRVLIWNSPPTSNAQAADLVFGQPSPYSSGSNQRATGADTLTYPYGAHTSGGRFYVVDSGSHRVLIWNSPPTSNGQPADLVVGQPNMTTNTPGLSASGFNYPIALDVAGGKLFVSDALNNRVLIWNSLPQTNNVPADLVLGAPDMTTVQMGYRHTASLTSFYFPIGVHSDGTRLYLVDYNHNRVVIWNTIPTTNNQAPDVVLGHPDFLSSDPAPISASSLFMPTQVMTYAGKLFVSDSGHNRVLIWNTIPTTNFQPADVVLGFPDMTSSRAGWGPPSASMFYNPSRILVDSGRLLISDAMNNRILVWNSIPTTNGAPADLVIGQPDMVTVRDPGTGPDSLQYPVGFLIWGNQLGVADMNNDRILFFDLPW